MNDCVYSPAVRQGITHMFDSFLGIISSADRMFAAGMLLPGIQHLLNLNIGSLKSKIPGVLFAQSHCDTINGRYDVISRLKELGIRIVAPGKCLNDDPAELIEHHLSDHNLFMGQRQKFWDLCRGVVFYAAIENSNEKLTNAIMCDAIPLVYSPIVNGKRYPDYSKRMPQGTYLNIADFETIEELAAHMEAISVDEELYRSYFWPKFASKEDKYDIVKTIASRAARDKPFTVNKNNFRVSLQGGCGFNDFALPSFRGGPGLRVYEDCIFRFLDMTARFGLTPYKIPLKNKRWWTQEEKSKNRT